MITVSIITVCFNSQDTIFDTLLSVANQTYKNIEHIIIDGGSTDRTMEIINKHGGHVSKIISEADNGIYDAMNKGLALAQGDLIGFLNADDFLAEDFSIDLIASQANGAAIIYGDLEYISPNESKRVFRQWNSGSFKREKLKYGWMPPHPTFYVRRDLFQKIGFFDTSFRISADYDFMVRCLTEQKVKVVYIPKVLVKMRMGGVSNRSLKMLIRKSREDIEVIQRHRIGGVPTLVAKNIRKLPQFLRAFLKRTT